MNNFTPLLREMPYSENIEQLLLGACISNPKIIEVLDEFLLPEHFYNSLHEKIFEAILSLYKQELVVSLATLRVILDKQSAFVQNNGKDYLIQIMTMALVVINPYDYGKIVYDLAIKRNLIFIGEEIVNNAYKADITENATDQLEQAENKLYNLSSKNLKDKSFSSLSDCLRLSLSSINKAMASPDRLMGVSTGIKALDKMFSGFQPSDLIIIAGRPSMGKTAFAINFALNGCKHLLEKHKKEPMKEGDPCIAFFSLEMSAEQVSTRILSMMSQIDSSALRSGDIREESYNVLRKSSNDLDALPLYIDDTPALSISSLRARARKMKRKKNLKAIFVDYLQLLKGATKFDNRVLEVSEITQGLKALAKELEIPVIALSQLSRAVEQRGNDNKRPVLSDLRDSGSIEQDADIVMFIYREEYYLARQTPSLDDPKYADWRNKINKAANVAEIIVAKHRNGAVGTVNVIYDNRYCTIKDEAIKVF